MSDIFKGRAVKGKSYAAGAVMRARAEVNENGVIATLYNSRRTAQKWNYTFELSNLQRMSDYELTEEKLVTLVQSSFGEVESTDNLLGTHQAAEGLAMAIRNAMELAV